MVEIRRWTLRSLFSRALHSLPPRLQCLVISLRYRSRVSQGYGCYLHRTVQVLGKASVRLGHNTVISQATWLNVNHRVVDHNAIEIGSHCFIGRRNFFSSGHKIVLGDFVLTANDCRFLGSSHLIDDPMLPYIGTGTTDTDVIMVGHNTFFGAGACVLGHVNIGHGSVIGANSLVTRDIPPFSQVAGAPATVRRRYSFPRRAWVDISQFTADDEAELPDADTYLLHLRAQPQPRMPYLAAGSDMGQC